MAFRKVIETIQQREAEVYRKDPTRLQRDSQTTRHVVADHADRWLWELLQNCDDAKATKVFLYASAEEGLLFVADNGVGFQTTSIEAIRGAYYSDKTEGGTIGRKGVGFKSVYNLTDSPKIVIPRAEGVEFDAQKCAEWLRQNNLGTQYRLHQWIPFLVEWSDLVRQYPSLKQVEEGYSTVVVLPYKDNEVQKAVEEQIDHFSVYTLMTFRYLREIQGNLVSFELRYASQDNQITRASLIVDGQEQGYCIYNKVISGSQIPLEILDSLSEEDRKITVAGGVSLLVACPTEGTQLKPYSKNHHPKLHVFYPTNYPAPIPLLLHAEFLVKTDRTGIHPIHKSPFNQWIARQLAEAVVDFVESAYDPRIPSNYLSLLTPHSTEDGDVQSLQDCIFEVARQRLRLPDISSRTSLTPEKARFIAQSCLLPEVARSILSKTPLQSTLVHSSFDNDADAQKTLRKLGVEAITNEDIVQIITELAPALGSNDPQRLAACWVWINAWLEDNLHARREKAAELPLIPIDGQLYPRSALSSYYLSVPTEETTGLPAWIPVRVLDKHFCKVLFSLDANIGTLLSTLKIQDIEQKQIAQILGSLINRFWKQPEGSPYRFLRFIIQRATKRTWEANLLSELTECPVPAYDARKPGAVMPRKAKEVYFEQSGEGIDLSPLFKNSEEPFYFLVSDTRNWQEVTQLRNFATVSTVLTQLGVRQVRSNDIQKLLQSAIERYWEQPDDDPYRFLKFILVAQAKGFALQLDMLRTCPVPAHRIGEPEEILPRKACEVYLSPFIGGLSLTELFVPEDELYVVAPNWTSIVSASDSGEQAQSVISKLRVRQFTNSDVQQLMESAIERYWQSPSGDPYRFLSFLLKASQIQGFKADGQNLWDCPVPTYTVENPKQIVPHQAGYSFMGAAWDNPEVERFYTEMNPRVREIHFICPYEKMKELVFRDATPSKTEVRDILIALSAEAKPFVNYETVAKLEEIAEIPEVSDEWCSYITQRLKQSPVSSVEATVVYGVRMDILNDWQFRYLCCIIHENWQQIFENSKTSLINHRTGSSTRVEACWWYDFRHLACPPLRGAYWQSKRTPLKDCWIAHEGVRKVLHGLIPEIDTQQLSTSEDEQKAIATWLVKTVGVKHDWEDIDLDEWMEILNTRIPELLSPEDAGHRKRVSTCYQHFLKFAEECKVSTLSEEHLVLLCRKGGKYSYENAKEATIYLDDKPQYTKHFENEVFVLEMPSRRTSQAKRILGVTPISERLDVAVIISDDARSLSEQEFEIISKSLPYLFAWARHQDIDQSDTIKQRLQNSRWYCDPQLKEEIRLENLEPRTVEGEYWIEDDRVYLSAVQPEVIAKALAEMLDSEERADFIENILLRSEHAIRQKLYSEGLNDTDIKEALEEWFGMPQGEVDEDSFADEWHELYPSPAEQITPARSSVASPEITAGMQKQPPQTAVTKSTTAPNPSMHAQTAPSQASSRTPEESQYAPVGFTGQSNPLLYALPDEKGDSSEKSDTSSELKLVDPAQVEPDVRTAKQRKSATSAVSTRSPAEDRLSSASTTLTPEQRKQIEQVGRKLVRLQLERQGFEVFEMHEVNKGYDLLARRNGEEYHIEVKAHRLGASKITLTYAEYLEYQTQSEGGYKWQLWHVQYLEEGNKPQITIYNQIPVEALQENSFTVDLAMCWGEDISVVNETEV
ncbi:MAG: DUF3883 domain-containing protein [Candidatus Caldarchaeum sp.]